MGAEPGGLGSSGRSIVEWPGSSAVILEIGDALPVTGPSEVISQCEVDDRDESGLLGMPRRFVAEDVGVPVAAAGYVEWSGALGHCGVAVGARHRDKGWG